MGVLDEPILTSSALGGQVAPFMGADLFEGPVTFAPETDSRYLMFVPLHDGVVSARHHVDGRWRDVASAAPRVHLQQPGQRIGWSWSHGARLLRLTMDPAELQRFVSAELRLVGSDSRITGLSELRDPEVCRTAGLMAQVLGDPRPGQAVLYESVVRMFVVHMARSYLVARKLTHGSLSGEQFAAIIDYIDMHLSDQIRIHDLSDLLNMSESAFLRAVKSATGETPHELVRRRRLEAARKLLREDILSLGQIASMTGFADQAHLSRTFKREFGVSPSQWRRSA
jgi:AraC-like DNA-binding protein